MQWTPLTWLVSTNLTFRPCFHSEKVVRSKPGSLCGTQPETERVDYRIYYECVSDVVTLGEKFIPDLIGFVFPTVAHFPSSAWQKRRDKWTSTQADRFREKKLRRVNSVDTNLNVKRTSDGLNNWIKRLFEMRNLKRFFEDPIDLAETSVVCDTELGVGRGDEYPGGRLWSNMYHGPLKKQRWWESHQCITAEH